LDNAIFNDHTIILSQRNSIDITGISSVISYDDETLILESNYGKITIKGQELHIANFNNEIGEFKANGNIHGIIYVSTEKSNGGFFSKILR